MAKMNYETVFASAGFAGNSFDIAAGYGVTQTPVAGDAAFAAAGKTITLTAGTWLAAFAEVGKKVVISGSTSNNGTFTIVSLDVTSKILTVLEALTDETPVGSITADGSTNPGLIDVLLKTGNGVLQEDAPLVLYSTGALGAARTLDIAKLEKERAQQGGEDLPGRWFYLSIQNSDISGVNSLTVSTSTVGGSLNGSATLPIVNTGDYLFFHEKSGLWRVNVLPRTSEPLATLRRVSFAAADWDAGATKNQIVVLQTGSPAAGQVGPHALVLGPTYLVQVTNTDLTPDEIVDVEVQFDPATGNITLVKANGAKAFSGIVTIAGALD